MACSNPFGQHEKPYKDIRALQLDHVDGSGVKSRNDLGIFGRGNLFYLWLIKHGYPKGTKFFVPIAIGLNDTGVESLEILIISDLRYQRAYHHGI